MAAASCLSSNQLECCFGLGPKGELPTGGLALAWLTEYKLPAGVIGVAVTGIMLERSQGLAGWWAALLLCAAQCLGGSVLFLMCARGERLFGEQV